MAELKYVLDTKFEKYLETFKNTSYDKENNEYICEDESRLVYDFDKIKEDKYIKHPSSFDVLLIQDEKVFCVEFKNMKYSQVNNKNVTKKLLCGKEILEDILKENNVAKKDYKFFYCVAYSTKADRWKRGVLKNEIQFGLEAYKPEIFDDIFTNDVEFFKNEYKKIFKKDLEC